MEASDKDGLSRGYGAVLWPPDDWADPARTAIVFDSERSRREHLGYAAHAEQVARAARDRREPGGGRGDPMAALRFRGNPRGP